MAQDSRRTDEQEAFLAALVAYQLLTERLRTNLEGTIRRLWRSLGVYRDPQMRQFIKQAVPIVHGAQLQMSALTTANLAQQQQIAVGGPGRPVAVADRHVTGAAVRNGADPADVYGRPFHLVWRQLDELPREPGSIEKAIGAGEDRAVQSALTDVQLAKEHAALQVLGHDDRVVGYRRVLEGPHSCALCLVASTQRYHKAQLLPMHPACDCSVAAIWGTADPGQIIEAHANVDGKLVPIGELPDVHDRIEQTFGVSDSGARVIPGTKGTPGGVVEYRDVLIVHEHGELGPVLAVRGRPFLGPNDLAAQTSARLP
jgi:hypothetical protein